MSVEGFEEWDDDFIHQLEHVEKLVITSSSNLNHSQPITKQQQHHLDHSPPRLLSQRLSFDNNKFPQDDNAKDREIDRLKKEFGLVSKQLLDLERECFKLKNERNETKFVYSHTAEIDTGVHTLKNTNLECGVPTLDNNGVPQQSRNAKALQSEIQYQIRLATSSSKAIGVQTDKADESSNVDLNDDLPFSNDLSDKLLSIWSSASDQKLGRNLISKLFAACSADFHFLFGCMSMNMSSNSGDFAVVEVSSNAALQYHLHSFHASEAAKVSHLYFVLTKICNGLLQPEALLGPLIDLCHLENVAILRSTLSILRVFLKHLFSLGRKLEERDSVKVEGAKSGNNFKDRGLFSGSGEEAYCPSYRLFGSKSSGPQILCNKRFLNIDIGLPLSCVNWVSLFDLLRQIALRKTEECVRLEAVSVMNVILLSTNAHAEREIFGHASMFDSISQFLKKEAGSHVQKEALHSLFLLLNCPKLLSVFCSGCKEGDNAANDNNNASTCKGFSAILEGLADCIACIGNGIQDMELRKRAVIMLAFLTSSGKSGFEILVNHNLPGERNFLMLILQVLMSEMDVEVSVSSEPAENIKARTLLMREMLILLNRLVSNPGYSAVVLRVLTASRDMASLTIDIVSRLSRKDQILRPSDSMTRQIRESEIVDLARLFKKRVFTYFGDTVP